MRTLLATASFCAIAAGATLGLFGGISRADHVICTVESTSDDCIVPRGWLPAIARDEAFVIDPQVSVQGICFVRVVPELPDVITFEGFETEAQQSAFFYSQALIMHNSEPFTHTGVLAGPGGPYDATGDNWYPGAVLDFGRLSGPGTYSLSLPGNDLPIHPGSSTTEFKVPGDCEPSSPFQDFFGIGVHRIELHGTADIKNGTCTSFQTPLIFTFYPDGTATSFQANTSDTNQGRFWPGPFAVDPRPEIGTGDWNDVFYVQNPGEPEAYLGAISDDMRTIIGRTAWKNCVWDFNFAVEEILTD